MKKRYKILSLFLAIVMTALSCCVSSFAKGNQLAFNSDGKFKIIFVTDLHYSKNNAECEKTIVLLNAMLDASSPDLVVLGGDNIIDSDISSFDDILKPMADRDIPFTLVLGNHDSENGLERDDMFEYCTKYKNCLAYDADSSLTGSGTHNLTISSFDGKSTAFNLWMLDSNSMVNIDNHIGYNGVCTDELNWFKLRSRELTQMNSGKAIPSIVFQHIPACEMAQAIYFKSNLHIGSTLDFADGSSYSYIPKFTNFDGLMFENACPSYVNYGEWDVLKADGNVLAVVTGHDHTNSFKATLDSIDMLQSPSFSPCTYISPITQGSRIITLDESGTYSTEILHTYDIADKALSQKTETSMFSYAMYKIVNAIMLALVNFAVFISIK